MANGRQRQQQTISHSSPQGLLYDETWAPLDALLRLGDIGHRITSHVSKLFGLNNDQCPNPDFHVVDQRSSMQSVGAYSNSNQPALGPPSIAQFHPRNIVAATHPLDTGVPLLTASTSESSPSTGPTDSTSISMGLAERVYYDEMPKLDRELLRWLGTTPIWTRNTERSDLHFS